MDTDKQSVCFLAGRREEESAKDNVWDLLLIQATGFGNLSGGLCCRLILNNYFGAGSFGGHGQAGFAQQPGVLDHSPAGLVKTIFN